MKLSQFEQYEPRTKELVCDIMGKAQVLFSIVTETGCDNFQCEDGEIEVIIKKHEDIHKRFKKWFKEESKKCDFSGIEKLKAVAWAWAGFREALKK